MDRTQTARDDVRLDLGTVTAETKGPPSGNEDTGGQQGLGGLSRD